MNLISTSAALGGPVLNVRQENRCGVCQSLAEGVGNREERATVSKQAPNPKTRAPKCQLPFLSLALGNVRSGGVEGDGCEPPVPCVFSGCFRHYNPPRPRREELWAL